MLGTFRDVARTRMEFLELLKLSPRAGVDAAGDVGTASSVSPRSEDKHAATRRNCCWCSLRQPASAAQAKRRCCQASCRQASCPPPLPLQKVAPTMMCPALLGVGVTTKLSFCDVMTGREPAGGVLISLPPHGGPVTLTFNLHNRHTYSEEQVKANRAFARYTATIGVLTLDNTLISRAVVQSEFRNAGDLLDRIGGGAGPGGVKAVAPTGSEPVSIVIPEGEEQVSILGREAHARASRRQCDLHVARPADRGHQQRDDRVSSAAAAAASQAGPKKTIGRTGHGMGGQPSGCEGSLVGEMHTPAAWTSEPSFKRRPPRWPGRPSRSEMPGRRSA